MSVLDAASPCVYTLSQQYTTLTTPTPVDVASTVGAAQKRT